MNRKAVLGAALLLLLAGLVALYWWQQRSEPLPPPPPMVPVPATPATPPPPEPAIRHPIESPPPGAEPAAPLPALADSDSYAGSALAQLVADKALRALIQPEGLIRRIVATVDNLPRKHAPVAVWPVRPVGGTFAVAGPESARTIGPGNPARYAAYVALAEAVDARRLVDLYVRAYPLFQRAHEELGYPHGYFNDRLIEAIDSLLEAPEPKDAVRLVQSKVLYEYADPALEARPAGQKIMMRMGAANAARVKVRLRAIHDEIMRRELRR